MKLYIIEFMVMRFFNVEKQLLDRLMIRFINRLSLTIECLMNAFCACEHPRSDLQLKFQIVDSQQTDRII